MAAEELCRKRGFSDAPFYTWRAKLGGMNVPDATRALDPAARFCGLTQTIRTDQGPEVHWPGKALDQWARQNGVRL